jgi:hypothetical protein
VKRRTTRLAARVAGLVVLSACLPLGGCAVSLFSDHGFGEDEDRIEALEKRMDAIEKASAPAAPHAAGPATAPAGPTK